MLAKMLAGVAAAMDKVGDTVVDAAKDVAKAASEAIGGAPMKALHEAQEKLDTMKGSLDAQSGPLGTLAAAGETDLPLDGLTDSRSKMQAFVDSFEHLDKSKLVPPGAMCIASCWVSSVKKKLEKFKKEVEGLFCADVAEEVMKDIKAFGAVADKLIKAFEELKQIPDTVINKVRGSITNLGEVGKIMDELDTLVDGLVRAAQESLRDLQTALTQLTNCTHKQFESFRVKFEGFLEQMPTKLAKAFKPPTCCCCCSKVGSALGDLQDTVAPFIDVAVDHIKAFAVTELELVKNIDELDLQPITAVLDRLKSQYSDAVKPLRDLTGQPCKEDTLREAGVPDEPPSGD